MPETTGSTIDSTLLTVAGVLPTC
jgi:hypothetical protein